METLVKFYVVLLFHLTCVKMLAFMKRKMKNITLISNLIVFFEKAAGIEDVYTTFGFLLNSQIFTSV